MKGRLEPLIGKDVEVAEWVCSKLPTKISPKELKPFRALGLTANGELVAGCIYHRWRKFDCEVTFASVTPRWVLPWNLAPLFHYPFVQRGLKRITLIIGANNTIALRTNFRIGFQLEGVVRKAYDGVNDALVLGMLREECRWLRPTKRSDRMGAQRQVVNG